MERDQPVTAGTIVQMAISTHTLTWSVTCKDLRRVSLCVYFNSHAHVERDAFHQLSDKDKGHFNSHAHVERDRTLQNWECCTRISTHTLTWSVTSSMKRRI